MTGLVGATAAARGAKRTGYIGLGSLSLFLIAKLLKVFSVRA